MSVEERDPYTGHVTTGHSWNGIKELNTSVPRLLLFCLFATFVFSVGYTALLPSWPGVDTFYKGSLDTDQRTELGTELARVAEAQKPWVDKLLTTDLAAIANDKELMSLVAAAGPALFKDNCGVCHGQQGEGSLNFPALNDTAWLWERSAESVHKTLQVGINAPQEGTRVALMPAFGQQKTLDGTEIKQLALYVSSFSTPSIGDGSNAEELLQVKQGEKLFAANCSVCHGASGEGNRFLGAPDLTDFHWLYGGDQASIIKTIQHGRAGQMPAWQDRLSAAELRLLTYYVLSLSQTEAGQ